MDVREKKRTFPCFNPACSKRLAMPLSWFNGRKTYDCLYCPKRISIDFNNPKPPWGDAAAERARFAF
jgi:hypothetical protein